MDDSAADVMLIEWGVAAQIAFGQTESGDQYLVESFPNGILVAVVDGLGHGPRAFEVARATVSALEGYAHKPVVSLLQRCHQELKGTRGVVMSLASFDALGETMTWLGVGNVNGFLLRADGAVTGRARESLLPRGGVVGYRLPTPYPVTLSVGRGDTLVLATDGVRSSFAQDLAVGDSPQHIADYILAHYGRGTDDALVFVARYLGSEGG